MGRRMIDGVLVAVGYMLSPLSWWNDLLVNVPLAYAFSLPFSLLDERLYLPAFVAGYWLTNVAGFVLMHLGGAGLLSRRPRYTVRRGAAISLGYTVVIVVLAKLGWLASPAHYLGRLE